MSNIHMINDTKQWRDFFDCYRSLPALWDASAEEYKNKHKKSIAYEKILRVYQKIDPKAGVENVKHRLYNIRTCYRRELNKTKLSEYSGNEIYVPKLWYFQTLDFLRAQNFDVKKYYRESLIKNESDEIENGNEEHSDKDYEENILPTEEIYLQKPNEDVVNSPEPKRKRHMEEEEQNNLIHNALLEFKKDNTEKTPDEASVYALGWAASYRKLSDAQKIYAKKAIEDILILGQLNQLHYQTVPLPTDL